MDIVDRIAGEVGCMAEVARELGISRQAVLQWKLWGIPRRQVIALERISGIPRHEIRPDIYPPPGK